MATPSLAMIPSAYADSKVYSVLPNNGDGDFTFNRDSSATRVGQNGLIQTVGFFGNQLVTNGDFATDSDWTKGTGWTISGGKATHTGATGNLTQNVGIASKTAILTFNIVSIADGVVNIIDSDISTIALFSFSTTGIKTVTLNLVGNSIGIRSNSTNASIDNVSVKEVTGDQPRLNYDISNGVVQSCPSLLLEPQSTNSVVYSEQVDNGWWLKSNITITPNTSISPDGTLNSDTLTVSSLTSGLLFKTSMNAGSLSFFAKDNNLSNGKFRLSVDGVGVALWNKDGSLYSVTGGTANAINYGNGWYRFSYNVTSGTVINYGIEGGIGESIFVWGLQNESSFTYPTSYIPTNGSSQTRAAESCLDAGNAATFNNSEGVFYAEISSISNDLINKAISLSDGSLNNAVQMFYYNVSNRIRFRVYSGGVLQGTIDKIGITIIDNHKIALKWESGFMSVFVDGAIVGTKLAITSTPTGLLKLNFNLGQGSSPFHGNCKDIRVYNEALTDAQLQTLTTL